MICNRRRPLSITVGNCLQSMLHRRHTSDFIFCYQLQIKYPSNLNILGSKLAAKVSVPIGQLLTHDLRGTVPVLSPIVADHPRHVLPLKYFFLSMVVTVKKVESSLILLIIQFMCCRPSQTTFLVLSIMIED